MSFTAQLFEMDSLLREGRGPARALGVLSARGALWLGDCLYYITYTRKPRSAYSLMIYDRSSGTAGWWTSAPARWSPSIPGRLKRA